MIADLRPGFGAWSGLHAAVAYSRSEWALVLACDYPFVTSDLLTLLAGFASKECDAVVPVQPDGRLQPLCALYRAAVIGPRSRRR
jgi:molybdopterin-guanine dinucleotide biosynthesis protein A